MRQGKYMVDNFREVDGLWGRAPGMASWV
jgi:hypothetical protein